MTNEQLFAWCRETGHEVSDLFSIPCASTSTVQVDWMHCVELGVGQDLCGNILWECVSKAGPIPGGSQNAKVVSLNTMLKAYNAEARPVSPIGKLTLKMIRSGARPPKLKSKAAECRGLQPWMKVLAKLLLENNPEYHIRMLSAADALIACSAAVDGAPINLEELQRTGNLFLQNYKWLHSHSEAQELSTWRFKPKHHTMKHLLHEVCATHGSPNLLWCWQDESLADLFAKAAKRRGGKLNPSKISKDLLDRVAALHWVS